MPLLASLRSAATADLNLISTPGLAQGRLTGPETHRVNNETAILTGAVCAVLKRRPVRRSISPRAGKPERLQSEMALPFPGPERVPTYK